MLGTIGFVGGGGRWMQMEAVGNGAGRRKARRWRLDLWCALLGARGFVGVVCSEERVRREFEERGESVRLVWGLHERYHQLHRANELLLLVGGSGRKLY